MKQASAAVGAAGGVVALIVCALGLPAGAIAAPEPDARPARVGLPGQDDDLKEMADCPHCATLRQAVAAARGTNTPGASWGVPHGGVGGGVGDDLALIGNTDVLNYNLTLEIAPSTTTVIGTNLITVRSLAAGLSSMDIELHQGFAVTALTVDGVAASFTRPIAASPQVMRVAMPTAKANGQQFVIAVSYNGVPVSGGFGSIVFSTQNGNPIVCTLSETRFAHTWWPVKENNNDKATGDLKFIVPDTLTVASNGLLVSETPVAGAKKQFRWVTNYQTSPYLFCFSATVYTRFTDTWSYTPSAPYDTTPINMLMQFFIYPASDTTTFRTNLLRTKDMLTAFSDKFGPYGFCNEKYGIYQFVFGGGMEHQTFSGQGGSNPSEQFLTAHELGHQWWGDDVTCANWQDIWLNEGFATYSEGIWRENRPASIGVNGLVGLQGLMAARRPSTVNGSVYCYDISSESRIFSSAFSYNKGAWALHMLRHSMGDTAFFDALRAYRAANLYSTATTAQFQAVCESFHGSSLDWYFQPWVYGIGAPTYQWATRPVIVNGQSFLEVFIEQVQQGSWPTFTMPLDVRAEFGGVTATLVARNDARREHLLLPCPPGAVTNGALDPDIWVLAVASSTSTSATGSKTEVAFPEGPAKITQTIPAPLSHSAFGLHNGAQAWFHKPMSVPSLSAPGAVTLTGARQGPVAAGVSVSNGGQRVVVTATGGVLAPDSYTFTVSASATDTAAGLQLDGEIVAGALPSGDGVAGGAAVITFVVDGCGVADVGAQGGAHYADGLLDNNDFVVFIDYFFAADANADVGSQGGVIGSDGAFDNNDFVVFIDRFFAGC
ncbi:MAG: M1 family metallopeptidase [Phycisphaerales bacterium]|nr:M1 family metallopeptidase [Phycisphaerales bacterium]